MRNQPWLTKKDLTFGMLVAIVLVFVTGPSANAQQLSTPIDSNSVMGFETPFAWAAKSSTSSQIMVSSTTTRTQGRFAYMVSNPGNLVTMTSAPVASTATALAGVGNAGALFQVDVFLPALVGNVNNTGQLQMFVNSPSRGLSKVFVGDVLFSAFRPGIYNTLKFPIPYAVGTALDGASFSDLTFIFMVSSPGQLTGPYLFDNLRVHAVQLVDAGVNTQPPPGYGGSVDFVVFGGTPVAQTFGIGVVQLPDGFHLKLGTAGTTTVQLDLGYDGTPSFTCTYGPDATDVTGKSYILTSCTGGMQAGDLVGANWARLTIVGGDITEKIRAQLALNPVGDTAGTGIIPAMPTFWGDFDGCAPTVVAAGGTPPFAAVANPKPPPAWIGTPSAACAAQTTQSNQIVTNYFNKVKDGNFPFNWVVPPMPELARRNGNGTAHNSTLPAPPGDPQFHYDGHVNDPPGGDWDAYYTLDGSFDPGTLGTDIKSHFDATGSGHVVLFGNDVNVLTVNVIVNTDISLPPVNNATGSGSAHVYVFGGEIATSNNPGSTGEDSSGNLNPAIGFDIGANDNKEGPGFTIQIWIFEIEVDAGMSMGFEAKGSVGLTGLQFSFGPTVGVTAHAFGGVNVGFASGGVDVFMPDLFHAALTANVDAPLTINTDPRQCSVRLDLHTSATAGISSGGGHVNLVASIGKCPFCWDDSWDVFDWNGLGSIPPTPVPIFDNQTSLVAVELPSPQTTCSEKLNVTISSPQDGTTVNALRPVSLMGMANNSFTTINCASASPNTTFAWSLSPTVSGDMLDPSNGQACSGGQPVAVNAVFAQPVAPATTSTRTVNLTVTYNPTDIKSTTITETGSASAKVTVAMLAPGAYIAEVDCVPASCVNPVNSSGGTSSNIVINSGNIIDALQLTGNIVGATGATTTTWTATNTLTNASTTIGTGTATTFHGLPANTITWNNGGAGFTGSQTTYNITMTTKNNADGSTFGTSSVQVQFVSLQ